MQQALPGEFSPREWQIMENDKEERRETFQHAINVKKMELALEQEKNQAEIALRTLEAKWSSWIALPKYLIKLPVLLIFGIAIIVYAVRKESPPDKFWEFISK